MFSNIWNYYKNKYYESSGSWTPERLQSLPEQKRYDMAHAILALTTHEQNTNRYKFSGWTKENLDYMLDHDLVDPSKSSIYPTGTVFQHDLLISAALEHHKYFVDKMLRHKKISPCDDDMTLHILMTTAKIQGWTDTMDLLCSKCLEDIPNQIVNNNKLNAMKKKIEHI